jgi:DHA1 family tetracycline resistance protein-like MFS transporter
MTRRRLKPLLALFIVCVIDVLGFGILIPLIPYMAVQFGATPTLNTWILGIYSASQLLAAPLWGRLSDRWGRRPILLTSMLGACASYVMLAFAHSLAALFLARALAGAMAGNLSAAMAYASDISKPAIAPPPWGRWVRRSASVSCSARRSVARWRASRCRR